MNTKTRDRTIKCVVCGTSFVFTEHGQQFFLSRGYPDPKRCRNCRQTRKLLEGDAPSWRELWAGGGGQ
jgi:hypothetical protein